MVSIGYLLWLWVVSGEILGKIGRAPSVSKSNCSHVEIFLYYSKVYIYSLESLKMTGDLRNVLELEAVISQTQPTRLYVVVGSPGS
jgi:hypothetical protein